MSFWDSITTEADSIKSGISDFFKPLVSPYNSGGMEFPVGQGLNADQTKTANEKIATPNLAKDNSFWGSVKNEFSPTTEPQDVRLPFQATPRESFAPPIVKQLGQLGFGTIEVIPKASAIIGGEFANKFAPGEVKANIDLRRLGFETPNYTTASKEVTDAINNGENPWLAGLRIVSDKTLDLSFGADLLSGLSKMSTGLLLNGPTARVEAQNIVDAYKQNINTALKRLKDSPEAAWGDQLAKKERTLAELTNAKNEAEKVLKEQGAPTAIDRARISTSRYTDLLGRQTPLTQNFWSEIVKPDVNLKTPTFNTSPILDPKLLGGTREVPNQPPAFGMSTKAVENVPASSAEEAGSKYFNDVIKPKQDAGEAVVIGADDLKDYFGRDYNVANHPIYSKAANDLFEKSVSESPNDTVKFTVGGTGSGKSDFLVPELSNNFNGVVYDSTGFNYEGIKKQINYAISKGKTPEVYAIIPDLSRSRAYTFLRELEGKHPVTETAFVRTHSKVVDTLKKLIDDGVDVNVLDTRNLHTREDVQNAAYHDNPIDLLNKVGYTEDNVKKAIKAITKENAQAFVGKGQGTTGEIPAQNRATQGLTRIDKYKEAVERAKTGEVFGLRNQNIPIKEGKPVQEFDSGKKLEKTSKTLEDISKRTGKNSPIDFRGNTFEDLEQAQTKLEIMRDAIDNNPIQSLEKYEAKSGIFKGELPEVLGKSAEDIKNTKLYGKYKDSNVLDFMKSGDKYIQEAGFNDSEEARAAYQQFKDMKEEYKQNLRDHIKDVKAYDDFTKQDVKSLQKLADQRIIGLDELEPPKVRGDLQSPKLDFRKWKDVGTLRLVRDTFERNLEKIAPKEDADALKKFIVDPVRANELARTKFSNQLKSNLQNRLKDWGIKRNTANDELIQKFGERQISLDELKKASPNKWQEIESAANHFRNIYDDLLDTWNAERKKFGFPAIPKVPNYFRHFDEINFFVKNYGFLRSQDELPSEIAGKTEFFKPGKPFTTAELHRTGNSTKYSAIGGFNNYIDSVSKQIFHMDSVQRGRALEKYMDNSSKLARTIGEPLKLSNVVANFREYVNNGLAGKTATLDRAIESTIGRPALRGFQTISKLIGKNIIVGNVSTALSHLVSLPLIGATTDKIPLMKGAMTTLTSPLTKGAFTLIDGQESSFLTRRYPMEEIMPTKPKTAENTLSYLFQATDKFKARMAVAGKYYEGIKDGLDPKSAMKQADTYGGKVLGDYSVGQKPNIMNTKTASLLAQFQLGLNDSLSVLMHDIPHEEGKSWNVASKLIQFAIFSYLFNLTLKNIRGAGKGIDPIDLGMTLTGLNDEGAGQSNFARFGLAAKDLAGELPFTSVGTGNFPLATSISQPIKDLVAGNYGKAAEGVLANFASPIGGGLQAKKTIEGAEAIKQGGTFGPSGKLEFKQDEGTVGKIKTLLFGKYASSAAQDYFNRVGVKANQEAPMKKIFDQVQTLKQAGKTDEAQKLVDGLSDKDYATYKTIRSDALRANTINAEKDMFSTAMKIKSLSDSGKTDEAQAIVDDMTDEEYRIYQLTKKKL